MRRCRLPTLHGMAVAAREARVLWGVALAALLAVSALALVFEWEVLIHGRSSEPEVRAGDDRASDEQMYAGYGDVTRVRLNSKGTAEGLRAVQEALNLAWIESRPLVLEGLVTADHLQWWDLTASADPAGSKLAQSLGGQEIEVLRYATRGRDAREGHESEDFRTRLMPVDSTTVYKLSDFLARKHQQEPRPWPLHPLPGEQFMFKRKVPRGYRDPTTEGPDGSMEDYVRRHLPNPELLWRDIGPLGSCQDGTAEKPTSG